MYVLWSHASMYLGVAIVQATDKSTEMCIQLHLLILSNIHQVQFSAAQNYSQCLSLAPAWKVALAKQQLLPHQQSHAEIIPCWWMQGLYQGCLTATMNELQADSQPFSFKVKCVFLHTFQSHYNQHKEEEDLQREGARLLSLLTRKRHCSQHAILEVQKDIPTPYWVCSSPLCPHHIQALPQLSPDLCSFLKYLFCWVLSAIVSCCLFQNQACVVGPNVTEVLGQRLTVFPSFLLHPWWAFCPGTLPRFSVLHKRSINLSMSPSPWIG